MSVVVGALLLGAAGAALGIHLGVEKVLVGSFASLGASLGMKAGLVHMTAKKVEEWVDRFANRIFLSSCAVALWYVGTNLLKDHCVLFPGENVCLFARYNAASLLVGGGVVAGIVIYQTVNEIIVKNGSSDSSKNSSTSCNRGKVNIDKIQ